MVKKVLFLCTRNYYRSRFAEMLFNFLAAVDGLNCQAFSRGLALEMGLNNVGPLSKNVVQALTELSVPVPEVNRYPIQVAKQDLHAADLIIALKEDEHRPYLAARYPEWMDKVQYWHVHDVHPGPEYNPLQEIEREVRKLVVQLS